MSIYPPVQSISTPILCAYPGECLLRVTLMGNISRIVIAKMLAKNE